MSDLTDVKFFLASLIRPIVKEAIRNELSDLKTNLANTHPANVAPIMGKAEVIAMTGWPEGTFYLKVSQMPDGVVIRGKSKRLIIDREKFMAWLKTPVQP